MVHISDLHCLTPQAHQNAVKPAASNSAEVPRRGHHFHNNDASVLWGVDFKKVAETMAYLLDTHRNERLFREADISQFKTI